MTVSNSAEKKHAASCSNQVYVIFSKKKAK